MRPFLQAQYGRIYRQTLHQKEELTRRHLGIWNAQLVTMLSFVFVPVSFLLMVRYKPFELRQSLAMVPA